MATGVTGRFVRSPKREQEPIVVGKKWDTSMVKLAFDVNSIADEIIAGAKDRGGVISKELWEVYVDPKKVIEKDKELIEAHLDRRIQLFFMQLISVYKTPYHFEWIEANDEYGKGSTVKLKCDGKEETFKTEAAHSSTLPCIMAYPKKAWDDGKEPEGFVYLKHGHAYAQQNGTMELIRCVNRADILIDGTHSDSRLRNEAIKVVNAVAEGKYGPRAGMEKFVELLEEYIEKGIANQKKEDDRTLALKCYLDRVREVSVSMAEDEGYFDQLLGVKIGHEREDVLRKEVYQKRFKLIQDCESIHSQIARDILDAQNAMLKTNKTSLKKVDYRLRYALLEDSSPLFTRRMEKLFCTSLAQLQAGLDQDEGRIRVFEGKERLRSFKETHKKAIADLKRTLRVRFYSMSSAELDYRSELFKALRWNLNGWRQREFVTAFEKKYPVEPMSIPMVSRMEQRTRLNTRAYATPEVQRRKDIDESKAKKIADAFEVDAGLFLPAVVSSVY